MRSAAAPIRPVVDGVAGPGADRIVALDVLRGIALLGMLLVHFAAVGGGDEDGLSRFVSLFLEDRFLTIFAMLFGASCAIQIERGDARGTLAATYFRRLAALAVFGFVAEIGFGYSVLLPYAIWGVPLFFVRRWPPLRLIGLAAVLLTALPTFQLARTTISVAAQGEAATRTAIANRMSEQQRRFAEIIRRKHSPDYREVVSARLDDRRTVYSMPEFWLSFFLPVILIGAAWLRMHLFDRPAVHSRILVGAATFGVLSWVAIEWILPSLAPPVPIENAPSAMRWIAASLASAGFGIIDHAWLSFAYIGVVLFALERSALWTQWFSPFAWVGRAALTNYFIHIVVLDLVFTPHGLAIVPPRFALPPIAFALFGAEALLTRWWLSRYRYGPLEWLWRSITYWSWQSQSLAKTTDRVPAHNQRFDVNLDR